MNGSTPKLYLCPICEQPVPSELASTEMCDTCDDEFMAQEMKWFKDMLRKDKAFRQWMDAHSMKPAPATRQPRNPKRGS